MEFRYQGTIGEGDLNSEQKEEKTVKEVDTTTKKVVLIKPSIVEVREDISKQIMN